MENSSLAGTHTDVAFVRLSTTQELAVSIRPAADGQGWMQPQRRECHGSELCQGQSWSPKHQPGRDECEKSRISPNPPGQCLPTPFLITCPRLVPLLAALLTRVTSSSVHSAKKMFLPGTLKAKKPHHLAVVRRREDGVLQPQADALIPPRVFLGDRSLAIKRYCGAALLRINLSSVSNQSIEDINLRSTSGLTAARLCNM
ncbi:uncharacterized protein [Anser cygnoides]|uniref:uncharacterized protein isoform X3 n=1 Tax=Anser cygnoides TaxID=8845 RepID=UPI0034D2EA66